MLRRSLSNSVEELEMAKLELREKIAMISESENEVATLNRLLADSKMEAQNVERELIDAKAALVESENLVRSLNESVLENQSNTEQVLKLKQELCEIQSVLGKFTYCVLFLYCQKRCVKFLFINVKVKKKKNSKLKEMLYPTL